MGWPEGLSTTEKLFEDFKWVKTGFRPYPQNLILQCRLGGLRGLSVWRPGLVGVVFHVRGASLQVFCGEGRTWPWPMALANSGLSASRQGIGPGLPPRKRSASVMLASGRPPLGDNPAGQVKGPLGDIGNIVADGSLI